MIFFLMNDQLYLWHILIMNMFPMLQYQGSINRLHPLVISHSQLLLFWTKVSHTAHDSETEITNIDINNGTYNSFLE